MEGYSNKRRGNANAAARKRLLIFLSACPSTSPQPMRKWSRGNFCRGRGQKTITPEDPAYCRIPGPLHSMQGLKNGEALIRMEWRIRTSQESTRESTSQAGQSIKGTNILVNHMK